MTIRLVDPTVAPPEVGKPPAPRAASLDGATLGLVDNGKTWGREILARVADNLAASHGVADRIAVTKQHVSFPPAPADVERLSTGATAIIAAIGD
ncbi:MAG: hypothetical protein GY708_22890 [Actinomycetia bacterium]|nr:hypothetical protein [Actinomycetes bacterium]MCP4961910.1 hypothetical protein [Actinomycetes bacterium]